MGKYSTEADDVGKSTKARASNLRIHYKNCRETCAALKGLPLKRAQRFLEDVISHKDIVPFFRYPSPPKLVPASLFVCLPPPSISTIISVPQPFSSPYPSRGST